MMVLQRTLKMTAATTIGDQQTVSKTDPLSDTSATTPEDADHSDDDDDNNGRNDEPYRHGHAVLRISAAGWAGEQKQD